MISPVGIDLAHLGREDGKCGLSKNSQSIKEVKPSLQENDGFLIPLQKQNLSAHIVFPQTCATNDTNDFLPCSLEGVVFA